MKNYRIDSLRIIFKNISFFYFFKQNLLVLKKNEKIKHLEIRSELNFIFFNNTIIIITTNCKKISNFRIKKMKLHKNLLISNLKKMIIEIQNNFFNKLKLVGIGFKVFKTEVEKIISFKLGFSHFIFFKTDPFDITILKDVMLFVKSDSHTEVQNLLGSIRRLKVPEVYKGKGVFYSNEKIFLKEGKKL